MSVRVCRPVAVAALLAAGLAVGACGSSGEDAPSSTSGAASSTQDGAIAQANKKRAQAAIAPFVGKPGPFPVTRPLAKKPSSSTTLTFMQCVTPVCALFAEVLKPATQAMGVKYQVIKTGASADHVARAFSSAAEQAPDGLLVTAVDPTVWQRAISQFEQGRIPIATTGVVNGDKFGLTTFPNINVFGKTSSERMGKLQADWVYAQYGERADVSFGFVPELPFSLIVRDAFVRELRTVCPNCGVRPLAISVTTLGNKAPQTIVSDLQSHPKTNVVVAATSEALLGLPQALRVAGLDIAQEGQMVQSGKTVATVGLAGAPQTLQYLKDGQQTVDLGQDLPVLAFTLVDAAVRGRVGPEDPEESRGLPVNQFLSKSNITFDVSKGWTGYPDYAERFAELWNP